MRLRKQLLIVSLITLVVPWAGCQYVREVDVTLRKGQSQALLATAKAVASRLGSDPASTHNILRVKSVGGSRSIYVHPLDARINTDGYEEDWIDKGYAKQTFQALNNSKARLQVLAGRHSDSLYLFLRTWDEEFSYFSPAQSSPLASDYAQIISTSLKEEERRFVVYASAPGSVKVLQFSDDNKSTVEHQVKGTWLEWEKGYQIELQLPWEWAAGRLGIRVDGLSVNGRHYETGNARKNKAQAPALTLSTSLSQELEIFRQTGIRLAIASNSSKFIAVDGDLETPPGNKQQHGFIRWFYDLLLQNEIKASLDSPQQSGQFETPEASTALRGESAEGWYKQGDKKIVRVSTPVYDLRGDGGIIGIVIADQNAESLADMTTGAFDQLLIYSVLVSTTAALTFLLYASWLSYRIRKLSHAAANVVSDNGKIADNFPVYKSEDEIGDLSRSYAHLLSRLREYTNYLRTLSSKLSHELRTPLAIVKSSLDNLEHEKLSKQAKVYADRAREGATRLSSILNAMSAASRVEQAIGAAELELIPLDELLRNLKEAYGDVYQQVSFKLRIQDESHLLKIHGSGELLVQMLDKLVDNAADFCPEQGLIELGLYRHNEHIVITVHNEGPPLPRDMQNQLFDSMVSVREKDAAEVNSHHLGLGLYIVRLIADFHRGEVQGYNVPDNSGVIFEVRLPVHL